MKDTWFIIITILIMLAIIVPSCVFQKTIKIQQETYDKCCGGNVCNDTYYDKELDLCILPLCKPMEEFGITCSYKP